MPQTRREDEEKGEFFLPILQIARAWTVLPTFLGMQTHSGNNKLTINRKERRGRRELKRRESWNSGTME
jgi:hypothetical protein